MLQSSWNPTNFNDLCDVLKIPITCPSSARELEVPHEELLRFSIGLDCLSVENLLKLSNKLKVSIDFLLGRTTGLEAIKIIRESKQSYFDTTYRIVEAAQPMEKSYARKDFFPYNLIIAIRGNQIDYNVSEDNLKGAYYALSMLPEREKVIILSRYRDYKTHYQVAQELGINSSTSLETERRAIRMISVPRLSRPILFGYEYAKKENELERRKVLLEYELEKLPEGPIPDDEPQYVLSGKAIHDYITVPIEKLELSSRSQSLLISKDIDTIGKLLKGIKDDRQFFLKFPTIGEKSIEKILTKLYNYTKIDCVPFCDSAEWTIHIKRQR